MKKYSLFLLWFVITFILNGCAAVKPEVYNYNISIYSIKENDSMNQVRQKLGSPQVILKDDPNTWYYITGTIYKDKIGRRVKAQTVVTKIMFNNEKVASIQEIVKEGSIVKIKELEASELQTNDPDKFRSLFKNVAPRPI